MAAYLTISDCEGPNAVGGIDDGMLCNGSEEDGDVTSECEEDEGTYCEDLYRILILCNRCHLSTPVGLAVLIQIALVGAMCINVTNHLVDSVFNHPLASLCVFYDTHQTL